MIDTELADEILSGQLDLMRFEASIRDAVLTTLQRMQRELVAGLRAADLTTFNKERMQALLSQSNKVIDRYYAIVNNGFAATTAAVPEVAAASTAAAIETTAVVSTKASLPLRGFMTRLATNALIDGAVFGDWWDRQRLDTRFRFARAVRLGVAQGESTDKIVTRVAGAPRRGITGVLDMSRSNARALVHTSIQSMANEARVQTFRENADVIDSIVWLATLDPSTCIICGVRDGREYTMDDPPQPKGHNHDWRGGPGATHWNCRCVATVKTKSFKDLGVNIDEPGRGKRTSADGLVAGNMTFEKFLNRKGKAFAEEVLGKGRAELWRAGKLSLEQLLDLSGNPMTLAQLKAKYL